MKNLFAFLGLALFMQVPAFAQFDGIVGTDGCKAIEYKDSRFIDWAKTCTVTRGKVDIAKPDKGLVSFGKEENAIGAVNSTDVYDCISLGDAGEAILTFNHPIVDGKLYVANSGGYNSPNYEKTVSVVDLASFTEIKKIEVGLNLNLVQKDDKGNLYISSRGNYGDIPTNIYRLNTYNEEVKLLGVNASSFVIVGDSLFAVTLEYPSYTTKYILYDLKKEAAIAFLK